MKQRRELEATFSRDAIAERFTERCGKALRFASRLTGQAQALPASAASSFRLLRARLFQYRISAKIEKVVHFGAFWCIRGAVVSWIRNALEEHLPCTPLYCTSHCITRKNSKSDAKRCKMMHGSEPVNPI